MSTQASLDITTGDTSTAAWADSVTTHLNTTETATPATVFEGKEWTRTDTDTLYRYTGSAAEAYDGYGAWTTYTPTIRQWNGPGSYGSTQTIGNGTLVGRYRYTAGRCVRFYFEWTVGSTDGSAYLTTSQNFMVSLPTPAANVMLESSGTGELYDASSGIRYPLLCVLDAATGSTGFIFQTHYAAGTWTNKGAMYPGNTPIAMAPGDRLAFSGEYETSS